MQVSHFEFHAERDKLGEGPLSEVYRAVDTHLSRTVALKILRAHAEIDPQADTRFRLEAKHTSNLVHPNIATVYEYGEDTERHLSFIAMEYLEGRTLDRILKEQTLSYEEALRIMLQVASALELVHHNELIHRDLKPGNVMVLHDGSVKLLDFGIARARNEVSITQHGMLVGTVLYMSPEQVRGEELDVRSDVFAFGEVLYHALTGALPFPGRTFPEVCMAILDCKPRRPSEVRPGLPPQLEQLLLRCLEPEPKDRFPDAKALHGALLAAAESLQAATRTHAAARASGRVLVAPIECGGADKADCSELAGSLRKDLIEELSRDRSLAVQGLDTDELPRELPFAFVLRLELAVTGSEGQLVLRLERWARDGEGRPARMREASEDRIECRGSDDWDLQAALVRGGLRALRRRLTEAALRPLETAHRDVEQSAQHAARAHETLHKGTTRHLLAAVSSFRRAIEADTHCAIAHAGLSEALVRKYVYWDGDTAFLDEAREHAARALALDPQCAEAHTSLGFAWHMAGHATDAQREYRLALQLDPDEWLASGLLGALLARLGNLKSADPLLRRAIALKPHRICAYDHLHGVLQRLERPDEAQGVAEAGVSAATAQLLRAEDDQETRLHLALLLARLGRREEGREHVVQARALFPRDGYTAFHAAAACTALGDLDAALEALELAQQRGYCIRCELSRNTDFEALRGLPAYQQLVG